MAGIRWRFVVLVFTGVFVALLPVLGFPRGIKNWLFVIAGLLVVVFAYLSYVGAFNRLRSEKVSKTVEPQIISDDE